LMGHAKFLHQISVFGNNLFWSSVPCHYYLTLMQLFQYCDYYCSFINHLYNVIV